MEAASDPGGSVVLMRKLLDPALPAGTSTAPSVSSDADDCLTACKRERARE